MRSEVQVPRVLRFRMFEVDLQSGELKRNGSRIKLQELPFQVLRALVERPGEVVTRQELHRRLWNDDRFVEFEDGLNTAVRKLREALKDDADNPRFIETLPRRGYRFVAAIEEVAQEPQPAEIEMPAPLPTLPPVVVKEPHFFTSPMAMAGAILVLVVVLGAYYARRVRPQPQTAKQKVIVAVLPFRNISGDEGTAYLADGITDAVITELGSLRPSSFGVIARTSTMQFRNTTQPANLIGKSLNAQYVLDGSLLQSGDRVRVTAQLVDVGTQTEVWARSYERDVRDMIAVEGEVALGIAHEIDLKLSPQQQEHLTKTHVPDPRAYEAYVRGRYFWNERTQQTIEQAISSFQQALAIDPEFAPAYSGLADSHLLLASVEQSTHPPQSEYENARAAAEKALALDPELSEAHTSLGMIRFWHDWNWNGAEQEFQRALELNPSNATAHHWYAIFLSSLGRHAEAVREIHIAQELDPLSAIVSSDSAWVAFMARRYDDAMADCRKALAINPDYARAHAYLGFVELEQGKYQQAQNEFLQFRKFENSRSDIVFIAETYSQSRQSKALATTLAEIARLPKDETPSNYNMALVWAAQGNADQAFKSLSGAFDKRDFQLVYLKVDPRIDALRSDPRFTALMDKVGLPR